MSRRHASTSPSDVDKHTERLLSMAQGTATEKENGSDEKYRLLFDSIRDIVLFTRLDGSIAEANKAAVDAYGYSKKELESMNIADLCIDDMRMELPGLLEKCYTNGCIYETAHRRKDGSSFPVEINSMGFTLHGEKAIISIGRDITERKLNEEALKLAQLSIERSGDEVFWITPEGVIFYANDAACNNLQYTREELRKMGVWDVDPIYTREVWDKHWQDIKARGSFTIETVHRAKDSRTYPVEVSVNYIKYGGREYNFVFARDITERKRLEEALKDREEKLRSRLSAILSPGDVGEKTISEVVDIPALQDLADSFNAITGAVIALLDLEGNVLVNAGWQDICTKFHRCHPETLKNCRESDLHLYKVVAEGEYSIYKCKNGLWDVITPIVVNGRSIAYIFAGQFLFDDEPLDYDRFVWQAENYGFNKEEYLAALERIPRYSREKVQKIMDFYTKFAMMISRLSYSNVQLARSLAEQKQAEEALTKAHGMVNTLLDQAFIGIGFLDLELRFILVNEKLAEINGIPAEAHIGKQARDIVPSLVPTAQKVIGQILATGEPVKNYEFSGDIATAPGIVRFWTESWYPMRDSSGSINGFGVIVEDITERKRAEEALRESESKYRIVADNTYDWEFWLGPDNDFRYISPSCERITGYSSDEFMKDPGLLLNIIHPDDREIFSKHLAEKMAGCGDLEFRVITKAGRVIWVHHACQPIFDENRQYIGSRGSNRDITERKRVEAALKDAKKQAELYLDLMGHDISNMNQIALGYLELADGMIEDEGVKELIEKPLDAIQNSSKLIENVRKLQKLKIGGLKKEAMDLDTLLVELRGQYLNVPGKDVIIDYEPCRDCYVMANGLLNDVFSNLIGNAIKHSCTSKSVRIGLRLERIDEAGRKCCMATVEDDGPGIPDALKKKIFARFQEEGVKASGRGLGLYLAKSLVEDFHGSIRVEDRVPGDHTKGARFVVTLPMAEKYLTY